MCWAHAKDWAVCCLYCPPFREASVVEPGQIKLVPIVGKSQELDVAHGPDNPTYQTSKAPLKRQRTQMVWPPRWGHLRASGLGPYLTWGLGKESGAGLEGLLCPTPTEPLREGEMLVARL